MQACRVQFNEPICQVTGKPVKLIWFLVCFGHCQCNLSLICSIVSSKTEKNTCLKLRLKFGHISVATKIDCESVFKITKLNLFFLPYFETGDSVENCKFLCWCMLNA